MPRREYAARAAERATAAGHPEISWLAEGAVAARWGDPEQAEADLVRFAASPQQAPRDEWRTLLFRAQAAARAGDLAGPGLAAQAFEAAGELGRPDLPALHEPDIAASVVELAREAGSQAASAASGDSGRTPSDHRPRRASGSAVRVAALNRRPDGLPPSSSCWR